MLTGLLQEAIFYHQPTHIPKLKADYILTLLVALNLGLKNH